MRRTLALGLVFLLACEQQRVRADRPPITVFAAASLAKPLRAVADSVRLRSGIILHTELGGSLEQARKVTDLGRVPDVLLLVDDDVMASLMPTHIDWYVRFATNQLVVAYTPKSRGADSINGDNWWRILSGAGVTVGRADPAVAPVGQHALAALKRAENYYGKPGLGNRLAAHAPQRFMRANAAELAALLETGEVDYIIDYASVARQYGFSFVPLPGDLSPPVLYSASVPRAAAHFAAGVELVHFLLSGDGQRILRDARVDVLAIPVAQGSVIPPEISAVVRTASAAALAR